MQDRSENIQGIIEHHLRLLSDAQAAVDEVQHTLQAVHAATAALFVLVRPSAAEQVERMERVRESNSQPEQERTTGCCDLRIPRPSKTIQ